MTITLHWWMLPLAIVIAGIFIAWRHEDRGGYMPDLTKPFVIFVATVIAVTLCVGHWL